MIIAALCPRRCKVGNSRDIISFRTTLRRWRAQRSAGPAMTTSVGQGLRASRASCPLRAHGAVKHGDQLPLTRPAPKPPREQPHRVRCTPLHQPPRISRNPNFLPNFLPRPLREAYLEPPESLLSRDFASTLGSGRTDPSKLVMRVRFPSPALIFARWYRGNFENSFGSVLRAPRLVGPLAGHYVPVPVMHSTPRAPALPPPTRRKQPASRGRSFRGPWQ